MSDGNRSKLSMGHTLADQATTKQPTNRPTIQLTDQTNKLNERTKFQGNGDGTSNISAERLFTLNNVINNYQNGR